MIQGNPNIHKTLKDNKSKKSYLKSKRVALQLEPFDASTPLKPQDGCKSLLVLAWLRLNNSREGGLGLVLELFDDKQRKELEIWTRGARCKSLGDYECIGEENGDVEKREEVGQNSMRQKERKCYLVC